jgi:acyl-CoA thioesterase-1
VSDYDPRAGLYLGGEDFGVPATDPPAMSDEELTTLIRFEHPAKLLAVAELPGAARLDAGVLAVAYATEPEQVARRRARLRDTARTVARELLADAAMLAAVRAIPVPAGGSLVALGDSITDDYLSWAEIVRECLAIARPRDAVAVVNAGVSGDTTADALRRLYAIARLRPDVVVTMLGTNDCQRHGPEHELLVAGAESARNLAAIRRWLARSGAFRVWITPPPVLESALASAVGERPFAVRDADVRAVARTVHELGDPVVDVRELFGDPPGAGLLMDDGVHPSLAGQRAIAAALIGVLGQARLAGSASPHSHSGTGNP